MNAEEFKKQIEKPWEYANDYGDLLRIRGIIARTLRLAVSYPELAKGYYDTLNKTTMDIVTAMD